MMKKKSAFKPCAGCPSPGKCKAAGACAMKAKGKPRGMMGGGTVKKGY